MELPYDLWEYTARFISPLQLPKLFSVNAALFNIAMNARYRRLELSNPAGLHILKNPNVARRVRVLHVDVFTDIMDTNVPAVVLSELQLPHLVEFTIKCPSDKLFRHSHSIFQFQLAFFQHVLSLPSLEILTVSAPLPHIQVIFQSRCMASIKELNLVIHNDLHMPTPSQGLTLFPGQSVTLLAPFINGFHGNLRALSIRSTTQIDFGPLFDALGNFPFLQSLDLLMLPTKCGLIYSSIPPSHAILPLANSVRVRGGLIHFLERHVDTLDQFKWSPGSFITYLQKEMDILGIVMDTLGGGTLMSEDMKALGLYIPDAESVGTVLRYVACTRTTLVHLHLEGFHLEFEHLIALVELFQSAESEKRSDGFLETLSISVAELSPRVVQLLLQMPRSLQKLQLHIETTPAVESGSSSILAISPSSPILAELEIRGCYLSQTDVSVIIDMFSQYSPSFHMDLLSLRLEVQMLQAGLLQFLAERLRGLVSCSLSVADISTERRNQAPTKGSPPLLCPLAVLNMGMHGHKFPKWETLESVTVTSKVWDIHQDVRVVEHRALAEFLLRSCSICS
ncbi:hypothetical protein C8J56DRAFT_921895 [Mycena floridula]|nr:hypothetical protein C8J56DRAFT_921895 [Mycena floridula]